MNRIALLLGLCAAGIPPTARADVAECVLIADDPERLACYDRLFRETGEPVTSAHESVESFDDADADEQAFGAENVTSTTLDTLEARLAGDFTGWTGKTTFTLDNGQVWRQTNNYVRPYKPRAPLSQPKVTITKGGWGSYNMSIEGVKRTVQVKRIK
jgi:hypothetical protein